MDTDFKSTVAQIKKDTESLTIADDYTLISSVYKEYSDPEYRMRNSLYSYLLNEYINDYSAKNRRKKAYKLIFFIATMLVFLALVVCPIIAILVVASRRYINYGDITVIIGSVTGIVSAIIVLPKIIAEHLFPINEETHLIEMVKNMQLNDSAIRDHFKTGKNVSDTDKTTGSLL